MHALVNSEIAKPLLLASVDSYAMRQARPSSASQNIEATHIHRVFGQMTGLLVALQDTIVYLRRLIREYDQVDELQTGSWIARAANRREVRTSALRSLVDLTESMTSRGASTYAPVTPAPWPRPTPAWRSGGTKCPSPRAPAGCHAPGRATECEAWRACGRTAAPSLDAVPHQTTQRPLGAACADAGALRRSSIRAQGKRRAPQRSPPIRRAYCARSSQHVTRTRRVWMSSCAGRASRHVNCRRYPKVNSWRSFSLRAVRMDSDGQRRNHCSIEVTRWCCTHGPPIGPECSENSVREPPE